MHQDIPHDIVKAAAGGGFAVLSWLGGQFAQAVEEAPSWVKAADTPGEEVSVASYKAKITTATTADIRIVLQP
jgi:hypothetical protein